MGVSTRSRQAFPIRSLIPNATVNVPLVVGLATLLLGASLHADGLADDRTSPSSTPPDACLSVARLNPVQKDTESLPLPELLPPAPGELPTEEDSHASPKLGARMDDFHDHTCLLMKHLLDGFDGWFARPDEEPLPSVECPFFVGFEDNFLDRGVGMKSHYRLNCDMKLRLPNFERRMRLFVTTEPLDEFVGTGGDAGSDFRSVRRDLRAGFGRQLDDLFNLSAGLRGGNGVELFGAIKWSHTMHPWGWNVTPSLKGYWTSKQGFGTSGGFLLERWQGPWLLRSASGGKFGQKTRSVQWSETVTFAYAQEVIKDHRFASLAQARDIGRGGGFNGVVEGHGKSTDAYSANVFYRLPLRGRWLFLHAAPELRWTAERDWTMDYGIRVGIDCVFSTLCAGPAARRSSP